MLNHVLLVFKTRVISPAQCLIFLVLKRKERWNTIFTVHFVLLLNLKYQLRGFVFKCLNLLLLIILLLHRIYAKMSVIYTKI